MWMAVVIAALTLACVARSASCPQASSGGGSDAVSSAEDSNLKEALLIVDLLKAEYARLFRLEAEARGSTAPSTEAPPPPPKQTTTREPLETKVATIDTSTTIIDIESTTHRQQDNERGSSLPNTTLKKSLYFRRAEKKDVENDVLMNNTTNSATNTANSTDASATQAKPAASKTTKVVKISINEDSIMSQVASELLKEIENARKMNKLQNIVNKTNKQITSSKRTRIPLGYLLKSTRLDAPFPANHPFCFTNPNNPFCRTFI